MKMSCSLWGRPLRSSGGKLRHYKCALVHMDKAMGIPDIVGGVIVPLVTPLSGDLRVDEKSLRKLVNYVVAGGVDGLFVMGTTGEFQYLPYEEQRKCISIVMEETVGRIPVVAGVTGFSVEETVRNVVKLEELSRPPAAVVIAPLVYHSNRKLPQHIERLCQVSNFPVLLYNNIGIVERRWKRKDVVPELAGRISQYAGVVGFKDSSGNMEYFREIVMRCGTKEFLVFQGVERLILESMNCGASGIVAGTANVFPAVFRNLLESYKSGDEATAKSCQKLIGDIAALYPTAGSIPAILKEVLMREGVISSSRIFSQPPENMNEIQQKISNLIRLTSNREHARG